MIRIYKVWVGMFLAVLMVGTAMAIGGPVYVDLSPAYPTATDTIHIDVTYQNPPAHPVVQIFVNRYLVKECEGSICTFDGGPYQQGLAYYAAYGEKGQPLTITTEQFRVNSLYDWDGDGIANLIDNCLFVANPDQNDSDYGGVDQILTPDGWGDACDNCVISSNPLQEDADKDTIGDTCDNCPKIANDQSDRDGDGGGDVCDNCPDTMYYGQDDWDMDGIGNACDCDDGLMGPFEEAADCGGSCAITCTAKYSRWCPYGTEESFFCVTPKFLPILKQGSKQSKIDVVFVMDADYNFDKAQFKHDVVDRVFDWDTHTGYLYTPTITEFKDRYNIWYYNSESSIDVGSYQEVCKKWYLPDSNFYTEGAFTDVLVILFSGSKRACTLGLSRGVGFPISSQASSTRSLIHESAHKIFGLADEYCCDGAYFEASPGQANVWPSQSACEAASFHQYISSSPCQNFCPTMDCHWTDNDACRQFASDHNLDPDDCLGRLQDGKYSTCSPTWCNWRGAGWQECCGEGWWKGDSWKSNSNCYLGGPDPQFFDLDCEERIYQIFATQKSSSSRTDTAVSVYALARPTAPNALPLAAEDSEAVALLTYHIKGNIVTSVASSMVKNTAPNPSPIVRDFTMEGASSSGEVLYRDYFSDPREFNLDDQLNGEQGMMMGDDLDFIVVLPVLHSMQTVVMKRTATGEVLHSMNMKSTISEYCGNVKGNDAICSQAAVKIQKSGAPTMTHAGDPVTYTYTVINIGDLALDEITVTDNVAPVPTYISGDTDTDGALEQEETWIYRSVANPIKTVTNTGTVTGTDPYGTTVSSSAQATVTVIHPAIHLEKTASLEKIYRGDPVTYIYTITNTGDIELSAIKLTDDKIVPVFSRGDTNNNGILELGETWTYTATNTPTHTVSNTAKVKGTDPLGLVVNSTDTATVVVTVRVKVDIKPGSCPNGFGLKDKGIVPVAILGGNPTYTLDEINAKSVQLNSVSSGKTQIQDVATPYLGTQTCWCHILTKDNIPDLLLQFDAPKFAKSLETPKKNAVISAKLTGFLNDGITLVEGTDCVKIA